MSTRILDAYLYDKPEEELKALEPVPVDVVGEDNCPVSDAVETLDAD